MNSEKLPICLIDMRFAPEQLAPAVDLLRSTIARTEAKTECRECRVDRDAADASLIRYSMRWRSIDALHRHLRSPEFRRVLVAMDMCCREPDVAIGNMTDRRGLACLRDLLGESEADPRTGRRE